MKQDPIEACELTMKLVAMHPADHCLGAAYRGECPGVDPDELMRWRAESRARFQGRAVEEVIADVERAQQALDAAPRLALVGQIDGVFNTTTFRIGSPVAGRMSSHHEGEMATPPWWWANHTLIADMRRDGPPVAELSEAASRLGIGYISGPLKKSPDRRLKITVSGTAEVVRAFIEEWAPSQGLVDAYGDPARGFGGAYLPEVRT